MSLIEIKHPPPSGDGCFMHDQACPGLDSNQHALTGTAPSRRRVYQFRHPGLCSDPGRTRTCDPLIKSQMLYHLSYGVRWVEACKNTLTPTLRQER